MIRYLYKHYLIDCKQYPCALLTFLYLPYIARIVYDEKMDHGCGKTPGTFENRVRIMVASHFTEPEHNEEAKFGIPTINKYGRRSEQVMILSRFRQPNMLNMLCLDNFILKMSY